jgi:hypothetical protein
MKKLIIPREPGNYWMMSPTGNRVPVEIVVINHNVPYYNADYCKPGAYVIVNGKLESDKTLGAGYTFEKIN